MKKKLLFLFMLMISVTLSAQQLAFPGAEGFGRFATGGRGGTIYHVTNLNDSGTGSLRDAVSQPNRIVVFDVSGVINLKSGLVFSGNSTILGQTAPGEGVQVYGDRVSFSGANNLIVRYMRFRMGKGGSSGKDAAGVSNGRNMIFDHLSVLWGRDECFSISWDNKDTEPTDITIQNSIIGQGLQSHSCGGLIQTSGGVTLYRNLYIENKTRNPKVKGLNQFVNNVVYNWGNGGCYLMGRDSEGDSWADIENNYFMKGPWDNSYAPLSSGNENFQFYGEGNYYDSNRDGKLNGSPITDSEYTASGALRRASLSEITSSPKAFPAIAGKMTAEEALLWMIDSVGPSLPVRDEVDKYLIDELKSFGKSGTNGGISDETTLPHKGTGTLYPGSKPKDSDGDGIPDEWEIANGLNPNSAADAVAIAANGYANIENYAFSITKAYPYIKNPSNLKASQQTKESVTLSWTDNADNENGYIIEYSLDNKTFTEKGRVGANVTSYVATGLTAETTYYFRIKAYGDDNLFSPYTAITTETIGDPSAPKPCLNPTPANNAEVGVASESITFSWENSSKNYYGTVSYTVYLGDDASNMNSIGTVTAKSLEYSGKLVANKTYYWRVDAKNDVGTTTGTVWTFKAVSGGTLFYTDFNTVPEEFHNKYPGTANTNIINGNTSVTVGGMTFGANGSSSARIVSFSDSGLTGAYSSSDEGATARCIEFTSGSGYVQMPEVDGPCTITIWTGNSDTNSKTFNLKTIVGGTEATATSFSLAAAKKNFKHTYTYTGEGKVIFKIDGNGKKFRVHDVLIEKYVVEPVGPTPDPEPSDGVSTALLAWGNMKTASYDNSGVNNMMVGAENDEAYGFSIVCTSNLAKEFTSGGNSPKMKVSYKGAILERTPIKGSNGAQNTVFMPEGAVATKVTFYSVRSDATTTTRTSWWKEVAGTEYSETSAPALINLDATRDNPNAITYNLGAVPDKFTFTNTGEQQCFIIYIEYVVGGVTGITETVGSEPLRTEYFTLDGIRVATPGKGMYVVRKTLPNGKKETSKVMF